MLLAGSVLILEDFRITMMEHDLRYRPNRSYTRPDQAPIAALPPPYECRIASASAARESPRGCHPGPPASRKCVHRDPETRHDAWCLQVRVSRDRVRFLGAPPKAP